MSTNRSPRYSAMLSLNPRAGHSVRSGANLVSRRGTGKLPDAAGPIRLPEFGIEISLDDVYSGVGFD